MKWNCKYRLAANADPISVSNWIQSPWPGMCLLDHTHPTRIYLAQPFLGRSCQNQLMRSNNFDVNVPVTMCHEVEAQANNCKNKASVWTDLKNFFAWLTGMTKLIFDYNNFFGSGHFLIQDIWKNRPKKDRSQKFISSKNYSFHACWPRERIFKIGSQPQ